MSELPFKRSRQDGKNAQLIYQYIYKDNVEIIRIKVLNLTYFSQFFLKVNLQPLLLGS